MSLNHNVDAQSIYGLDTMPQVRSRNINLKLLDTTAPEFKEHNKEESFIEMRLIEVAQNKKRSHSLHSENPLELTSRSLNSSPKVKRWFESGSIDSIHLGSSVKLFDEPETYKNGLLSSVQKLNGGNERRRSSLAAIFKSFR